MDVLFYLGLRSVKSQKTLPPGCESATGLWNPREANANNKHSTRLTFLFLTASVVSSEGDVNPITGETFSHVSDDVWTITSDTPLLSSLRRRPH